MKNDQLLLEQMYEKVLFQEMMLPNFQKVKQNIDSQLDQISTGNDQIATWLKKRIITLVSKGDEQQVSQIINIRDGSFTSQFRDAIVKTKDYLQALEPSQFEKATRGDFNAVMQKAEKWHQDLAKPSTQKGGDTATSAYLKDTTPFFDLKNGWQFVRLSTQAACKLEGQEMQNCIKGGGFKPTEILSLRDPQGRPHVSIHAKPKGNKLEIHQIKGKNNKAPKPEYAAMVRKLIASAPDRFEIVHDATNIGFIQWEGKGYDPDGAPWQKVFKTSVLPKREKIKKQIMAKISNGVQNENKQYRRTGDTFKSLYNKLVEDLEIDEQAVVEPETTPITTPSKPRPKPGNPNPFRKPNKRPAVAPKPKAGSDLGDTLRNINRKYQG